jgi:hypothetical protein
MTLLLIAQLISTAPPLPPAQAAAVLRQAAPDLDRTVIFVVPEPDAPTWVSTNADPKAGPFGSFGPRPVLRPLNCCGEYRTRLPRGYARDGRKPITEAPGRINEHHSHLRPQIY